MANEETATVGPPANGGLPLDGKRVLVVGASSGLGRGIAMSIARDGGRVAFAARRAELLADAAERAGNGAIALCCDVCDDRSCEDVVAQAADAFDGLDALVYAPAIIAMSMLMDADGPYWERVLRTNVIGAALVTRAAMPHLEASNGRVVYLSSVSAGTAPWPGLGVYITSKAALDRVLDAWREEHPNVSFSRVSVGPAMSEPVAAPPSVAAMSTAAAQKVLTTQMEVWVQRGYVKSELVTDATVGRVVAQLLAVDGSVDSLVIQAR